MKPITIRLTDQQAARIEEIAALCQLAPESLAGVLALSGLGASDYEPDNFIGSLFDEAAQYITKGNVPGNNICRWLKAERKRLGDIRAVEAAVHRKRGEEVAHLGKVLQFTS